MALILKSHAEQVADYLRAEILRGRWGESMPGALLLKAELGTSGNTIELALQQLEGEGALRAQGIGRRRRIVMPKNQTRATLRIAILLFESDDRKVDYLLDLLHQLKEEGYAAFFTSKTLKDLGMDVRKVAKFVSQNEADAWIVVAGSRPVLNWFAAQSFPTFGLFGRIVSVPIASTAPRKIPALQTAVQRLVALGHRRIVFLVRGERRKPVPGFLEQAFLDELEAQGISTGSYNLPDWEETPEGFGRLLQALFRHTPPTALLTDGTPITVATLQHFTMLGIQSPRDVSLVCMDPDPAFASCHPVISHIAYNSGPWLRQIVRWANNIACGKDDRRKSKPLAKFVEGGTIGPAPKSEKTAKGRGASH